MVVASFRGIPFTVVEHDEWQPVWQPTVNRSERPIPFSEPPKYVVSEAPGSPFAQVEARVAREDADQFRKMLTLGGAIGTLLDERGAQHVDIRLTSLSTHGSGEFVVCTFRFEAPHPGFGS